MFRCVVSPAGATCVVTSPPEADKLFSLSLKMAGSRNRKEIDSASASGVGLSIVFEITLFERVTDDSVWKIFSVRQ